MFKFTRKYYLLFILCLFNTAQAGIITTDLTADDYVSYKGLDWAWASPVNVEHWGSNILKAPDFHSGWRVATEDELTILRTELGLTAFTKENGQGEKTYIEAVQYWNTEFVTISLDLVSPYTLSTYDFENDFVSSDWLFYGVDYFDTFYVRESSISVPEPTTLLIFSIALIIVALRKSVKQ